MKICNARAAEPYHFKNEAESPTEYDFYGTQVKLEKNCAFKLGIASFGVILEKPTAITFLRSDKIDTRANAIIQNIDKKIRGDRNTVFPYGVTRDQFKISLKAQYTVGKKQIFYLGYTANVVKERQTDTIYLIESNRYTRINACGVVTPPFQIGEKTFIRSVNGCCECDSGSTVDYYEIKDGQNPPVKFQTDHII